MTTDIVARIDSVLLDLRSLGTEIVGRDFSYPVEQATFESGAAPSRVEALVAEPLPVDYEYFLSRCAGFAGMDIHNGHVMYTPEEVGSAFARLALPRE